MFHYLIESLIGSVGGLAANVLLEKCVEVTLAQVVVMHGLISGQQRLLRQVLEASLLMLV